MYKNYVAPDLSKESFTCPHCGTLSLMRYEYIGYNGPDAVSMSQRRGPGFEYVIIASCLHCKGKTIWINDQYVYPDIVAEEANPDMPEPVKQLYNEAGLIYSKSPRAACALLRLALDRLCHELGENDRDINKNIGALVKKGLSQSVQQALDVVRVVGNKAVHPGQIAFDVDDRGTATMLMRLLNIIVDRMITEPNEIDSLYQGLPESAKESIEKRDK